MASLETCWLSLGGNLPDSRQAMQQAVSALDCLEHTHVTAVSSLYRTPPWGGIDQDDFLNAVLVMETSLSASALLQMLLGIETEIGRHRDGERWGPRLIDLDLLLYGSCEIREAGLEVPHPRMHERAFVLLPMTELDEEIAVPGIGKAGPILESLEKDGITCEEGPGWVQR